MTRSSRATLPFLLLGPLLLAGCSHPAKTFGLELSPPDAFAVGTEAPLSVPPDLQTLPPPVPGAPRPQQVSAAGEAQSLLAPQSTLQPGSTSLGPAQQALLQQAGPTPPAHIRATINRQAEQESRGTGFVDSLMSFGGKTQGGNQVVNAQSEQKRLQENAALGEPATKGATPAAAPAGASKGLLGRVLDLF
ncbi:DUF3035 domain-containing protein [Acidiphilium sp. C61]|jgi:hypothetical protein|uniref:DUF3035 domain-containing protein n=1 Tax=Acidiphilium sp. C61 TaxID=1671485 RepID=UPI00157A9CFB|nr:DUF3035 domain-containing protein [Acidiphilium sp. C61]